jgi:hypothetical protein
MHFSLEEKQSAIRRKKGFSHYSVVSCRDIHILVLSKFLSQTLYMTDNNQKDEVNPINNINETV